MQLRSSAFANGAVIPVRYTCDGDDVSPPLSWSGAPPATRSFTLLCDDPDAPAGTWHHWAAYDIPAGQHDLTDDAAAAGTALKQAVNDFRETGYGGPCPPVAHGVHHYRFRVLALAVDRLPVADRPSCQEVERAARKHLLAEAVLIGLYQR